MRTPTFNFTHALVLLVLHFAFDLRPTVAEQPNEKRPLDSSALALSLSAIDSRASLPSLKGSSSEHMQMARETYVWAWPMVYLHNASKSLRLIKRYGISGGTPVAPINHLGMLTRLASSDFRSVPCPNRDVLYGYAMLDLRQSPVVLQIPEFGTRFWMIQTGDLRTHSFASLGSMHQTKPGNYLIVGPTWDEPIPEGISEVLQSPTHQAFLIPRVAANESDQDQRLAASLVTALAVYPLRQWDGSQKNMEWSKPKWYPAMGESTRNACRWVQPNRFFDDLSEILSDHPVQAGEELVHARAIELILASANDSSLHEQLQYWAQEFEKEVIEPMFDFRNVGSFKNGYWTSFDQGSDFGSDFLSRTAAAKSNIFINRKEEAKYFYLEQSSDSRLLDGRESYRMTFLAHGLPKHEGFWSLTVYDENHRLLQNPWHRYKVGSASEGLQWNEDGSLTILFQPHPTGQHWDANWIPIPEGRFSVYLRVYAPSQDVIEGIWKLPSMERTSGFQLAHGR